MSNLFVRLLGPFEVILDEEKITSFHSDKERALLAYLCLEVDGAHRREKLAGLLWPDYPESAARTNLRNALANLRRAIGDRQKNTDPEAAQNFLHISRKTLQFNVNSDSWVDVLAFLSTVEKSQPTVAELEAAVACCRDEFMVGFSLPNSSLFEEWLLFQRERFNRLAFDSLYRLVEVYSTQGEYKRALGHAWGLVSLDPLSESAQQLLIRLLAYNDQPNKALLQYETYANLLADEIGVEPLEKTTDLYLQIKDGSLSIPKPYMVYKPAFLKIENQQQTEQPVFVGRERQIARLDQMLDQALVGQGQVVFLTGEAGSGKTVLANEFLQRSMKTKSNLLAVSGRCNAYTGYGDPYLPFMEIMEMLTGEIETRWAGGEISGKHARRLWRSMPDVLGAIMANGSDIIDRFVPGESLFARARSGAPDQAAILMTLLEQKEANKVGQEIIQQSDLFKQYTKTLQGLSSKHPIIMMLDDLQWADPGSIGLLFHLGRRLSGSRILLMGAYRPEEIAIGRVTGSGRDRHPLEPVINELQLDYGDMFIDLDKAESRDFVDALIDNEPNSLAEDFREELFQRTGGHPLFTVEFLRGLQNRGDLYKDEKGRWAAKPYINWKSLPPRVDALIAERMSRLPRDWQSALSTASVQGEEFTAEVVAKAKGLDESQVLEWLSGPLSKKHHLVQAKNLEWLGEQRLSRFRFIHFLFQKYLYDKLDPVQRSHLHQAVGTALEVVHGDNAEKMAVSLARHFEEGGMTAKAIEYLIHAGNRAVRLYANEEAIAHFQHGIGLVKTLGDKPQRDQLELALQLALGVPLTATHGFSGEELAQTYGRAWELTHGKEASYEIFQTLGGLKAYYDVHGDFKEAKEISEELLSIANQLNDPGLTALAHHQVSVTLLYLGKPMDYLGHREQMTTYYEPERDRSLVQRTGIDAQLANLNHAGWAYWFLGYPDKAKEHNKLALDLAREWGNPFFLSFALMFAAYSAIYRRDLDTAHEIAEETIAVASEHGHPLWLGGGIAAMGWVLSEEGNLEEGITQIQRGMGILKMIGAWLGHTSDLTLLAGLNLKAGKRREGLAVIDEILAFVDETGGWMEEPEVHRLKGELLLLESGNEPEAEACFQRAIEVAKKQNAKSWELRATMSLCRLMKKQGKQEQARRQLSEIYNWFTEGFDTPDLQEAKSLLDALS